ncbi:MAG: ATP-binding cassette domain-containing protein [Burkholderiales bacterium]|jgi:ATP-binding cassette subfamily F protein 3|nr:putative ABC transporter ATP-binding protein YheS [Betaproteobacteria bacterium MOLA814]|tara:strand:- start:719 stop:2740 length:2022 start_codon:yes stop_codon:yes gene_type:complete
MITLTDLTVRRGTKVLLDKANLTIHPGEKASLIGRNGAGKSTLFALLTGDLTEDGGEWFMPKSWRMAQVAQNMPETDESATDFVLAGDTRLVECNQQLALAEESGDGEAIGMAYAELSDAGAFDAQSRAQTLIMGLGFSVAELNNPVNSFSGGWRMRLQLARALMCPADLMLLDEPTNHLDLDALVWLEAWLKRYEGTMIIISHDREFLDAVTRVTVNLDNAQLTRFGGNYSTFEDVRAQQLTLQQAAFSKQQDRIAHLQLFIDRFKAKASKAKQAQSRVKALERMERVAQVITAADFTFEFKEPASLPNPMITIRDAVVGYTASDGTQTPIVGGITRSVVAGQRIGLLGANGQGKSTLVKTIAGALKTLSGEFAEGKGLSVGYFAQQELDVLQVKDSPLEHMIALAKKLGINAREQELRDFLGSFRFVGAMVGQTVGTMSGGEKARLVLAMVVYQRPNLLLLDEPTNHLDLTTREALAMALNAFSGTVMLVSHDRALLRSVCDDFWLVAKGGITEFEGDLDDYQVYLLDQAKQQREAANKAANKAAKQAISNAAAPVIATPAPVVKAAAPATQDDGDSRVNQGEKRRELAAKRQAIASQTKPFQQQITAAETNMAKLELERDALNRELLALPSADKLADIGRRLKGIDDELAGAETKWLEASQAIEALTEQA